MVRAKVMIVDDDQEFLQELSVVLASHGYDVVASANPAAVKEIAVTSEPAVIVLDLKMRGQSGLELADELRRFTKTLAIPVIAMTGFFTESEHMTLLNICGIRTCLKKPFAPYELMRAIETELTERRRA